ncbi:MAG: SUMF1/EgtB/PvdO family nonheme iron enzyme [Chitinophagales bacterium]
METAPIPIKIFIAYSRKDEAYLKDLRTYLKPIERNHSIETWSDENILAGKPWEKEIKDNLHAADIILLLVSANSLASDYFYEKEMADALVRHDSGEAVVIPIILSHCAWEITELKELQALPKDGIPITKWQDRSEAYTNIVLKLQENIEAVLEKKAEEQAEIKEKKRQETLERQQKIAAIQEQERLKTLQLQAAKVKERKRLEAERQRKAKEEQERLQQIELKKQKEELEKQEAEAEQKRLLNFKEYLLEGDKAYQHENWVTAIAAYKNCLRYSRIGERPHRDIFLEKIKTAEKKHKIETLKQNSKTQYAAIGTGILMFFCLFFWGISKIVVPKSNPVPTIENQDIPPTNSEAETDTLKENLVEEEGVEQENGYSHKYTHWLNLADTKYNQKDWQAAKEYYEEAAKYESTKYVKERIAGIDWRLKQEEETTKLNPEIQKLVDDMVLVKGGSFKRGENNAYEVTLSSFSIGKYEVTQEQWKAVMGVNPSTKSKECSDCPVETVSWDDTQEFIQKLNQLTGEKFRLPTEAEWEFAARGGIKSQGYEYAGSNNIGEVAWYSKNTNNSGTKPVGKLKANELGLYDMSGNVYEWCSDWDDDNYYKNSPSSNPQGPNFGISRVLRGGSWNYGNFSNGRVSTRSVNTPTNRDDNIGFRLVQ